MPRRMKPQFHRRNANPSTPKKAKAEPVCPEGKESDLYLSSNHFPSCETPYQPGATSVLFGRARPDKSRTVFTAAPASVAASIIQRTAVTKRRGRRTTKRIVAPKTINSGQSPTLEMKPA